MFNQNTIFSPEMRHEQTCEQFAVISFPDEEETFYIVASSWLEKTDSSDFHICSWPPYKGDTRIKVAVLENETPSCNWSKCNARLIKRCSTYESAEEILRVIEIASTRRSEMLFQKKYKQIQNECFLKQMKMGASLHSSQGSFNSSSSFSYNASQPGPFICAITSNADESFLHNSSPITSVQKSRRNSLSTQTESFLGDDSRLYLLSRTSDAQILNGGNIENESHGALITAEQLSRHTSTSNFELHVLKTLSEIKGQITQNAYQLNEFSKQISNLSKEIFDSKENFPPAISDTFKEVFPFSSAEDLQQFDLKLKDKNFKNKLIRHFSKIGGTSVTKCTLHLLNFIMKPSAAVEYSWFGRKDRKKAFYCLELVDAIQETVRIHFKDATDKEIMKISQDWFRHAKEKLERSSKSHTQKGTFISN